MELPERFYKILPILEESNDKKDFYENLEFIISSMHLFDDSTNMDLLAALISDIMSMYEKKFDEKMPIKDLVTHISVSSDITKDFKKVEKSFYSLHEITCSENNYSPSFFRDEYRHGNHFLGGNEIIVLDIDEGMEIKEATKLIRRKFITAMICTTRNHQKEKNGKVCDRFRIIAPLSKPFQGTSEEFKIFMKNISEDFGGVTDKQTFDSARYYYGNPNGQFWYFQGTNKVITEYYPKIEIKIQSNFYKTARNSTDISGFDKWTIENEQDGQRNSIVFRARMFRKDRNMPDEQIYEELKVVNAQSNLPLTDEELRSICRIN